MTEGVAAVPGQQEHRCGACNGDGITTKIEHSVETDESGRQQPVTHTRHSSCTFCGGTGSTSG
ncbi:hypothetical protein FGW37_03125 [Streptomyces rectiverticillatus]|uniref:hypothetical protein n=1 Tax=Streptomyces rectiverticillatus TaxID=173860 RepID=UPI0015C3C2C9|nr:hypothetical protein [Streptomyces rectiverticillatus]QLE70731.1 hypothetical protein FGW37_03125 [Streptomyces rectiverticillatus]